MHDHLLVVFFCLLLRNLSKTMKKIAVIGAGLAGLVVARELSHRSEVMVFEKSRGVGGRIATRYAGDYEFDHGAQFFTAQSPEFKAFLQPLIERDIVANWRARFAELKRSEIVAKRQWNDDYPHYVGTPRMNAIGKSLARDLDVQLQTTVARLERSQRHWMLFDDAGTELGQFDWVVITAPAPQTAALVPESSSIRALGEAARMQACCAVMLAFERQIELPFDAALVRDADISWVSVNSSKPGRTNGDCLVIHSTNAWADAHIDVRDEAVLSHLLTECSEVLGIEAATATFCGMHRWRYANIGQRSGPGCGIDAELQLAACGDWFIRGRVEAAYTSAVALIEDLRTHF